MPLTIEDWHARFVEQSRWTAALRAFLFSQCDIDQAARVLEVGCGTGAILHDIGAAHPSRFGIDLEYDRTKFAHAYDGRSAYACADGFTLPFASGSFDLTFCHYYLLWQPGQTLQAINEMKRVTRPGGKVLALAEPAYSNRIDYPAELIQLGKLQTASLVRQGIDAEIGLRLPGLFSQAGLAQIQYGQSGFQNAVGCLPGWFESEWQTLQNDLDGSISADELAKLRELDRNAWMEGTRVLQIPTFYAFGSVPEKVQEF
jgi:Methylase involved in ubiquinone/menaquinone biosynthesis